MAMFLSFWLLSAIITHYYIFSINAKKSFVRPPENVSCPSQPCLALNDYAQEPNQYFLDDSIFLFLPGIHQLDIQLHLKNVSNVTFLSIDFDEQQDNTARVFFSPSVNITWTDCDNIKISGLVFILSGHSGETFFSGLVFQRTTSYLSQLTLFGNGTLQSTAIFLSDSSQVKITDVQVSGATSINGSVLYALNSTIDFLGQNDFVNNTATDKGGAIVLCNCISNFSGNISFINNTACLAGGALALIGGVHNILGNVSFVNNTAKQDNVSQYDQATALEYYITGRGGAILAEYGSTLTFETTSNVVFTENTATYYHGGAIYISESNLTLQGRALFERNTACQHGGAIRADRYSWIYCNGSILFQDNTANGSGGAIFLITAPSSLNQRKFSLKEM